MRSADRLFDGDDALADSTRVVVHRRFRDALHVVHVERRRARPRLAVSSPSPIDRPGPLGPPGVALDLAARRCELVRQRTRRVYDGSHVPH